ncbi:MAG: hypothetical protein K8H85_11875 [Cyclobacteriaceae bacterium]|nr:hypothetical protein [Cyclobacteriaceae bacterium]
MDSLRKELEHINEASLRLRQNVTPTIKRFGYESPQMDSLNLLIQNFDSLALIKVENIISRYGWLGKSKIGELANSTLFMVIQHAQDNRVREKFYPLLEESVNEGESRPSDLATMKDRILIQNGQPQIYGTQTDHSGQLLPVEDIKDLNKRRRRMGLKKIKMD